METTTEYPTDQEVATLVKVDTETIYRWLWSGKLPGAKIGDSWRIRKSDIEAFFGKSKETEGK